MSTLSDGLDPEKQSKVEKIKTSSQGLSGNIADQVENAEPAFDDAAIQLLKHHGTYQQDNRDVRRERRKAGLDKDYTMMVRTKTPGGLMSAEQYLLCDDLADKYGQSDLRITSRQGFQFHGVVKGNLRSLIHDLNHLKKISTQGACGDVVRNVMACPVIDIDPAFEGFVLDLMPIIHEISDHFLPRSSSYFDLWLDDERVTVGEDGTVSYKSKAPSKPVEEPIYGEHYLPRKFKIGVATDLDNSVDVYTQDVGIIVLTKDGKIDKFEILAGGGLGHSHSKTDTYARLGTHITCVDQEDLTAVIEAVVKVQRDHGNREHRHQARLKYTLDRLGVDRFRELVAEHFGKPLPDPTNIKPAEQPDYLGWHKQHQAGLNYVGIWIENGRVKDFDEFQFRTGIRTIVEKFQTSVRLTGHHNIILANIRDEDVNAVKAILEEFNIPTFDGIAKIRRHEMACPALPLCGLALAEAEREMPNMMQKLEELGCADDDVVIRVTGCPNSCARPETAEIGVIGRGPNKYNIYLGGDRLGSRMNQLFMENVTVQDVPQHLSKLLGVWREQRTNGESFGDWSFDQGNEKLQELITA